MTELDRLSISSFDIISARSGNEDKLKENDRDSNNQKKIRLRENSSNQSFKYSKQIDRSWNVCYGTTLAILLFYLILWIYFEQKELKNT